MGAFLLHRHNMEYLIRCGLDKEEHSVLKTPRIEGDSAEDSKN